MMRREKYTMKKTLAIILFMLLSLYAFSVTSGAAEKDTMIISGCSLDPILTKDRLTDKNITSISVPENIRIISADTFNDCSRLEEIKLHGGIQCIGDSAFAGTAFYNDPQNRDEDGVLYIDDCLIKADPQKIGESYTVRDGTRLIANRAFVDCTSLKEIVVPDTIEFVGGDAFHNTAYQNDPSNYSDGVLMLGERVLISVDKQHEGVLRVNEGVEVLGDFSFIDCKEITEVRLPDTLRVIGNCAFCDMKLKELRIPENVNKIGWGFLRGCSDIEKIILDNANPYFRLYDGLLCNYDVTEVIRCSTKRTDVALPETVQSIAPMCFEECRYLKAIEINEGCRYIGTSAFSGCYNIESLIIPDSVEAIGKRAFISTQIKELSLPSTLKEGFDSYYYALEDAAEVTSRDSPMTNSDTTVTANSNNAVFTEISKECGDLYIYLFIDAGLAIICLVLYRIRNLILKRWCNSEKEDR